MVDNLWRLEVDWVNIDDNVWRFDVSWWVIEWQFVRVIDTFGLDADNKRNSWRSLKYIFLQLAANWLSLGDDFWQL